MNKTLFSTTAILIFCLFAINGCKYHKIETTETFTNPLLQSGPDPWVFFLDGNYYYIKSQNKSLILLKTPDITKLANADQKIIWQAPDNTDHSHDLWAPEIHYLQGAWYVYYAADDGNHHNHRLFVLENQNSDPFEGNFTMKARLKTDKADNWAIDGTVFELNGELYLLWSGWREPKVDIETQRIYIAKMANPWTVATERVQLNEPEYDWERKWDYQQTAKLEFPIYVNEGPQFLTHGSKMHLIYSCSGCWTPYYALGMLTADINSAPLNPESWTKSEVPVFYQSPENGVYGTGHNCFFKSPDDTEDWILYHANNNPDDGCGNTRSPRAQRIHWKSNDMPDFGMPLSITQQIEKPSGTPASE